MLYIIIVWWWATDDINKFRLTFVIIPARIVWNCSNRNVSYISNVGIWMSDKWRWWIDKKIPVPFRPTVDQYFLDMFNTVCHVISSEVFCRIFNSLNQLVWSCCSKIIVMSGSWARLRTSAKRNPEPVGILRHYKWLDRFPPIKVDD